MFNKLRKDSYVIGIVLGALLFGFMRAGGNSLQMMTGVPTAIIKVMQAMLSQKQPLSKLAEPVTLYPKVLKNVRVADKDAALNDPAVQAAFKEAEAALAGNGRVLLRKSGTEPVVRVMAEAEDESVCKQYVDMIVNAMKRENLVVG